ncbi:MAG: class I SAM-dependent methyltransferase [Candidatus Nomurabacteria bacterium]|jgi:SAM-dependent methyltransferase|nr:class I SAM-dependent methyltransferase [Candidatus Nomurabacteria bacterium]
MEIGLIVIGVVLLVVGVFLVTALFGAPYVPSLERELTGVFEKLRPLTKEDVVVDFGSGDGIALKVAAKSGAGRVVGLELNPFLVGIARFRNRKLKNVEVKTGDMMTMKWPDDMTVVYVFGLDRVMKRLKPRLEKFARGQGREIDVISKAFEFAGMKASGERDGFYLYKIKGSL